MRTVKSIIETYKKIHVYFSRFLLPFSSLSPFQAVADYQFTHNPIVIKYGNGEITQELNSISFFTSCLPQGNYKVFFILFYKKERVEKRTNEMDKGQNIEQIREQKGFSVILCSEIQMGVFLFDMDVIQNVFFF